MGTGTWWFTAAACAAWAELLVAAALLRARRGDAGPGSAGAVPDRRRWPCCGADGGPR
ncbi:hypothetical protein [Streptomyces sp. KL110A]|uniref:hypothetical protein n=1 Tax=Streptomyces sp. KL110A TaxID=3384221 RepID=UPI0038C7A20B